MEKRPGDLLKTKCLLVFEKYHTHLMDSTFKMLEAESTNTAVFSGGGLIGVLHAIGCFLNKLLKENVRFQWTERMTRDHSETKYTICG